MDWDLDLDIWDLEAKKRKPQEVLFENMVLKMQS